MSESEPAQQPPSRPPGRQAPSIWPLRNLFGLKGRGNDCLARLERAPAARRK